jgi:hypothetical protein
VSEHRIWQPECAQKADPELHQQVIAGDVALTVAATEVDLRAALERYPFIREASNLPPAAAIEMARSLDKASADQRPQMLEQAQRWCTAQPELRPERRNAQEQMEARPPPLATWPSSTAWSAASASSRSRRAFGGAEPRSGQRRRDPARGLRPRRRAAPSHRHVADQEGEVKQRRPRWLPKQQRQDAIAAMVLQLTAWTSVPADTAEAIYRWLFGDEALFVAGTEMRLEVG